jgi:hypothetical protein
MPAMQTVYGRNEPAMIHHRRSIRSALGSTPDEMHDAAG